MAQRTASLKLVVSDAQAQALQATADLTRACFGACAAHGWEAGTPDGVSIHKATYRALREKVPALPSQLVISARRRAADALRGALRNRRRGLPASCPSGGATVRYDARSFTFKGDAVSLAAVGGRLDLGWHPHPHAVALLARAQSVDSAELRRKPSGWWLQLVVTPRMKEASSTPRVVGVDLGQHCPAVASTGRFFGERRWRALDSKYFRLYRSLMGKGTKSAKRRLRALRGRWRRFRLDCDHVVSRRLVDSVAEGTLFVLEDLAGIRKARRRGARSRRAIHGWSFARLQRFIRYKAVDAGGMVAWVSPRLTSQRCCRCGHTARRNREARASFRCRSCGLRLNADLNAARNIGQAYLAGSGMPEPGRPQVNGPYAMTPAVQTSGGTSRAFPGQARRLTAQKSPS